MPWWLLLPAQGWHLVSHPKKLFNPLNVSLAFSKCHCTSSSISVSTGHGDQDEQVPQAQWVMHVTKHLTSSVLPITLLFTQTHIGGSGCSSHTSSQRLSFSAASQLHSPFLPASSSSPWRSVTSVSLSFKPFSWPWARGLACVRLMGRREISSSVCLARHSQYTGTATIPHSPFVLGLHTKLTTARHANGSIRTHLQQTKPSLAEPNSIFKLRCDSSKGLFWSWGWTESGCNDCAQGWAEQEGPAAGSCAPASTKIQ